MDAVKACQHCGKPITPKATHGLCPDCLMKVGLGSGTIANPTNHPRRDSPKRTFAPPSSCSRGLHVDVRLDEVVLRALEKQPELRYQQASQIKTDVQLIATTPTAPAANANDLAAEESWRKPRIRTALWVGCLALGVFMVLAALLISPGRINVTGRVTDSFGRPLAGVQVRASPLPFSVPWSDDVKPPKDAREFVAVTDAEGRYRLQGLSTASYRMADTPKLPQEYDIVANAPRFAPQKIRLRTSRRDLSGLDFALAEEGSVAGRAVDTRGRAIAGLAIRVVPEEKQATDPGARHNLIPAPQITDAAGSFRFEEIPSGLHFLEMAVYPDRGFEVTQTSTRGSWMVRPGQALENTDFVFEAPEDRGGISGPVVDAESGALIQTFSVTIPKVDLAAERSRVHGRTWKDGSSLPLLPGQAMSWKENPCLIEDISPGLATLEISADGYARTQFHVQVVSGQTTNLTFALKREGILRGQVTLFGKPCGHGYVNARRVGQDAAAGIDAQTDSNGCFEFRGLPAGDYLVRFCVWLREDAFSAQIGDLLQAQVQSGQTSRLDFDFGRKATIRGRFTAPDKRLRWRVEVEHASHQAASLLRQDRWRGAAWKLENTGKYSIEGLAPGTYHVTGKCCSKEDEQQTPVIQLTKTITLVDGQTAEVDFVLTDAMRTQTAGTPAPQTAGPVSPPSPVPPVVVQTIPESGTADVDPALAEIQVTFSKPMQDASWSWSAWNEASFPPTDGEPRYLPDGRTCVLPVRLQPGRVYALWLNSETAHGFKDTTGQPALPYLLIFETRK